MGFIDNRFCVAISDQEKPENDASKYCDQVLAICLNDNGHGMNRVTAMVGGDITELVVAMLHGEIGKVMEDAAREMHMKHLPWVVRFFRREERKLKKAKEKEKKQ